MKLSEIRASIELEGVFTDEELEAMCEELDNIDLEGAIFDTVHSLLTIDFNAPILAAMLAKGTAKIGISE